MGIHPQINTAFVRTGFSSLEEWRAFVAENPWTYDRDYIERLAEAVGVEGVASNFFGHTPGSEVTIAGKNYRETILAHGCSARARAMLEEVLIATAGRERPRILLLEAITAFALALKGRYPYVLATEYLPTQRERDHLFPIPHCDILDSGYASESFDVVVSNDVLEHVPDLKKALKESRRILRAGGVCLATFPFASGDVQSVVRARLTDRGLEHMLPPEYHGNPVDPQRRSLVFAVPAWDILDVCRSVGFRSAEMIFISSVAFGITGSDCAGVHILRAQA